MQLPCAARRPAPQVARHGMAAEILLLLLFANRSQLAHRLAIAVEPLGRPDRSGAPDQTRVGTSLARRLNDLYRATSTATDHDVPGRPVRRWLAVPRVGVARPSGLSVHPPPNCLALLIPTSDVRVWSYSQTYVLFLGSRVARQHV